MTKYESAEAKAAVGKLIINTRPGNVEIYLDGQPILDYFGHIAKAPIVILNVSEGIHNVTLSKDGYDTITIMVNVQEGLDSDVKAILNTSMIRYPMMLSTQDPYINSLQPAPGWPALPIPQVTYGHIVANTIPDGAEVYLDGQPVYDSIGNIATTPVTLLGITTGVHSVTFRKKGYSDETVDVLIQNGLYSDAGAILRSIPILSSSLYYPLSSQYMDHDNNINNMSLYTEPKWYMEPDYIQPYYLQPRQRGAVHFDTQPHGAIIMVDGQYIINPDTEEYLRTPTTILLFEGRRDFVLKLENHYDVVGFVDVYAGSRVDIFRNMEPIPGSNTKSTYSLPYPYYPGYGNILIDSNPQGGYIYIDGYPMIDDVGNAALTPVKATGIMEGMHEIRIAKDGYYEKQLIVNVISGQDNIAFANLQQIYG